MTEFSLVVFQYAVGFEAIKNLSTLLMLISIIFLPFIAGILIGRNGGNIGIAILGAVSISVINILTIGVIYLINSVEVMAFGGVIISTLMFYVVPQIIFGGVGGIVARKKAT